MLRFGSLSHTYDYSILTYVYNFALFFRSSPMQGNKVALSQIHYCLVPQLLLQMGIIHPCSLQAVQYFKEYCFFAPVRLVFTFATLRARMVANILRISRGFRMVAKRVYFQPRILYRRQKYICRFVLIFKDSSGYLCKRLIFRRLLSL